jgi:hypothetical protein
MSVCPSRASTEPAQIRTTATRVFACEAGAGLTATAKAISADLFRVSMGLPAQMAWTATRAPAPLGSSTKTAMRYVRSSPTSVFIECQALHF